MAAALTATLRLAATLAGTRTPAVLVTVFPDSGRRYVSEGLFVPPDDRSLSHW